MTTFDKDEKIALGIEVALLFFVMVLCILGGAILWECHREIIIESNRQYRIESGGHCYVVKR